MHNLTAGIYPVTPFGKGKKKTKAPRATLVTRPGRPTATYGREISVAKKKKKKWGNSERKRKKKKINETKEGEYN